MINKDTEALEDVGADGATACNTVFSKNAFLSLFGVGGGRRNIIYFLSCTVHET